MYSSQIGDAIGFLFILAGIGILSLVLGAVWLIWWLITHVSIVLV